MQKYLLKISIVAASLMGFLAFSTTAVNAAACTATTTAGAIQCGTNGAAGVPQGTNSTDDINTTISRIINILSVVVGIIAVVMIIVGGFRYITSGGDTAKVGAAKNAILYAAIGLVIVALAQVIAKFVLHEATAK